MKYIIYLIYYLRYQKCIQFKFTEKAVKNCQSIIQI